MLARVPLRACEIYLSEQEDTGHASEGEKSGRRVTIRRQKVTPYPMSLTYLSPVPQPHMCKLEIVERKEGVGELEEQKDGALGPRTTGHQLVV